MAFSCLTGLNKSRRLSYQSRTASEFNLVGFFFAYVRDWILFPLPFRRPESDALAFQDVTPSQYKCVVDH